MPRIRILDGEQWSVSTDDELAAYLAYLKQKYGDDLAGGDEYTSKVRICENCSHIQGVAMHTEHFYYPDADDYICCICYC